MMGFGKPRGASPRDRCKSAEEPPFHSVTSSASSARASSGAEGPCGGSSQPCAGDSAGGRSDAVVDVDAAKDAARGRDAERVACDAPARLRKLYESHDGKLCLFECGEGHLAAVDASRLA